MQQYFICIYVIDLYDNMWNNHILMSLRALGDSDKQFSYDSVHLVSQED